MQATQSEYYNLACVYALNNKTDKAFQALRKAVELGLNDRKLLESDPDLAFIRSSQEWQAFIGSLK
jgi:hypothetical protein